TSPVISWGTPDSWKYGSVGSLIPGVECRVVDDTDRVVAAGEEGEACFRGPNVMAGYFKQPELTRSVMEEDGFFRSGDWGRLDAEGFLFITGRKKEMLIIGGENVFPREIEEVLNGHPAIHDSAVVARMDPVRGELPVAFVELNGEETFDEKEARAFCRGKLAGFKVPREIRTIETLPRNATGKILRRQLQP
ncbi:MAG: fatty acid--CoA ligase family protein, partial [Phycisphaerae bacterium]|nr:fatty acid--CoA ligase family protein [Phycisphaerae bacterium]